MGIPHNIILALINSVSPTVVLIGFIIITIYFKWIYSMTIERITKNKSYPVFLPLILGIILAWLGNDIRTSTAVVDRSFALKVIQANDYTIISYLLGSFIVYIGGLFHIFGFLKAIEFNKKYILYTLLLLIYPIMFILYLYVL